MEENLARKNIKSIESFLESNLPLGKKFLVGVSGGVDSTALAYLISQRFGKERLDTFTITGNLLEKRIVEHAIEIGNELSDKHSVVPLSDIFSGILLKKAGPENYAAILGLGFTHINNIHTVSHTGVISSNLPEVAVHLGQFGTYQGELSPFAHFLKSEVYAMANELGVPKEVVERIPGSGIKGAMNDEELVGVPYKTLERYLVNVKIKDDGSKAFALEYKTSDREGVRLLCGMTKKQLEHLEYRLLNSARFWIREGPHPKRELENMETGKIQYNLFIGDLFRPPSYTIDPAYPANLGILPVGGDVDRKSSGNIRREFHMYPEGGISEVVMLRREDAINLLEYLPEGLKITTVRRGAIGSPPEIRRDGC